MYNANDTIFAVSSPTSGNRIIIRITGHDTIETCQKILCTKAPVPAKRGITKVKMQVDNELAFSALLYLFPSPHSYTGDDVAEIHTFTNSSVTEAILDKLLRHGLRAAEPGEFTARAFLNGKIDLAQAEAVNEIIVSSNQFQLAAAQSLLTGRLSQTTEEILSAIMDCMSRIEAGLDFSGEGIEFISRSEAVEKLTGIKKQLEALLSGSIKYESDMDLPSVGIAAHQMQARARFLTSSSALRRSIVSGERKTTRDVLIGVLELEHSNCVLFDCAGLIMETENILDELAQQSAIEALRNSSVVIFCVDITKDDWSEDYAAHKMINTKFIIPAASKCDMVEEKDLSIILDKLKNVFGEDFLPFSAKTGQGIDKLLEKVDSLFYSQTSNIESPLALVSRHKKAVTEALANLKESIEELSLGNDEVCAMLLRAAFKDLSQIEQYNIDDQILEQIFSRFCIGK